MTQPFSPQLMKELLDDFYAESDELLNRVRQALSAVETAGRQGTRDEVSLETISRAIHTLKGNAAIVGLQDAERLAHAMEDLLGTVLRQRAELTGERIHVLALAAQRLEQIVAAHRVGRPAPETVTVHTALQEARGECGTKAAPNPAPAPAAADHPVASPSPAAAANWIAWFEPSQERDQRGVQVGVIRQRLGDLGTLVSAEPVISGSKMRFRFHLHLPSEPGDRPGWEADGVIFERLPAPATAAVADAEVFSLAPSHLVRVDLGRLDELMRITGEMVIQRSRLHDRIQGEFDGHEGLTEIDRLLGRSLRAMRQALARVRLVPIAEIFARIPFVVRDLAAESGKAVRVAVEGHQTEIDKYVAERLKEPLLHLVRNALTHGIEPAAERTAAGKPAEAVLTLRAASVGEMVVIEVADDGRGINETAVIARARALGLPVPTGEVAEGELLQILCTPGFSTREEADRAAGRGVGMAVVATTVRELGGTFSLLSRHGQGTRFVLRLPLTLSIVDAIILAVDTERFAVPQSGIDEIVQTEASALRRVGKVEVMPYRDGLLPLIRLRALLQFKPREDTTLTVLVLHTERGATGLVVDRVLTRREVVVRPLQDPLVRVPGVAGATELGDGRPLLILDPSALASGAIRPPSGATASPKIVSS